MVLVTFRRAGPSNPEWWETEDDFTHEVAAAERGRRVTPREPSENVLEWYEPRAERFHTGAAVHLPSQRLQPIDVLNGLWVSGLRFLLYFD